MANLAQVALSLARYAEAVAVVREGLVTAWTVLREKPKKWAQPGVEGGAFPDQRDRRERGLGAASQVIGLLDKTPGTAEMTRKVAKLFNKYGGLRNDFLHCAFRAKLTDAVKLKTDVQQAVDDFQGLATELAHLPKCGGSAPTSGR